MNIMNTLQCSKIIRCLYMYMYKYIVWTYLHSNNSKRFTACQLTVGKMETRSPKSLQHAKVASLKKTSLLLVQETKASHSPLCLLVVFSVRSFFIAPQKWNKPKTNPQLSIVCQVEHGTGRGCFLCVFFLFLLSLLNRWFCFLLDLMGAEAICGVVGKSPLCGFRTLGPI